MRPSRRHFVRSLCATALVLSLEDVLSVAQTSPNSRPVYNTKGRSAPQDAASPVTGTPLGLTFIDVAKQSGLSAKTTFGGEHKNKFLLETTGCGVAFYDFDHDDWLDIFLVNGTTLQGFPKGQEPTNHLFKNNRDGTFTDITDKAGLTRSGWARAAASATTTTTAGTTCSSPTTGRTSFTTTTATEPSPTSRKKPA